MVWVILKDKGLIENQGNPRLNILDQETSSRGSSTLRQISISFTRGFAGERVGHQGTNISPQKMGILKMIFRTSQGGIC